MFFWRFAILLLASVQATSAFSWLSKVVSSDQEERPPSREDAEDALKSGSPGLLESERIDGEDSLAETVAHRIGDLADNDDFLGAFHSLHQKP